MGVDYMIDLEIDNHGDICLNKSSVIKRLKIGLFMTKYPVFKATIRQQKEYDNESEKYKPDNRHGKIKLKIKIPENKNGNLSSSSIHDEDEIRQRITILFRTNKGEILSSLKNSFGSKINMYRHKDITLEETRRKIADLMRNELIDILDNPYVIVQHKYIDGPFYSQNITAYIYDDEQLICDMVIEEA